MRTTTVILSVAALLPIGCAAAYRGATESLPAELRMVCTTTGTAPEAASLSMTLAAGTNKSGQGVPSADERVPYHTGTFLLAGAGVAVVVPFDGALSDYSGTVEQYGAFAYGGVRLMHLAFESDDTPGTSRLECRMLYLGARLSDLAPKLGYAGPNGGWNMYVGLVVGGAHLDGPGVDEWGFAGALAIGAHSYLNAATSDWDSKVAVGVAIECGFLWSTPGGTDVGGLSTILGAYVFF